MNQATTSKRPPRLRVFGLLLVLVLGVIATVVTIVFRRPHHPSWARIHEDMAVVSAALEKYRADKGSLPDADSLEFLVPEYLPTVPLDPWGRPYIYLYNGKQPLLVTFGHDGERGGSGEEQDHNQHDGHVR